MLSHGVVDAMMVIRLSLGLGKPRTGSGLDPVPEQIQPLEALSKSTFGYSWVSISIHHDANASV